MAKKILFLFAMPAALLLLGLSLGLTGCGGSGGGDVGGGGGGGGVTGINWSCTPSSLAIMSGQTLSCTVTLTGTGDLSVTFAVAGVPASAVVITGNSLVLTAPDVTSATTATITATSNQTPSFPPGKITVTITPLVATITSVAPDVIALTQPGTLVGGIILTGSGFKDGETLHTTLFGDMVLTGGTNPSQLSVNLAFNPADTYSPGPFYFWVTVPGSPDTTVDNAKLSRISFIGDQNTGTVDPTSGEIFHYEPVTGTVYKFKPDGTPDGNGMPVGKQAHGIAFDNKSGLIVVDASAYDINEGDGFSWRGAGGTIGSNFGTGIVAKDGYSCFSRPYENMISCYDLTGTVMFPDIANTSQVISSQPWSQAMVRIGGELDTLVYSRSGTPQLWRISVPDMQIKGSVATGTAPVDDQTYNSGSWLVAFDSGPAAGTAVLLTHEDAMLTFVDIASMTVRKQTKLTDHFGNNIHPFRLATDVAHGTVIVATTVPGPSADLTRFASVNVMDALAATGTVPITDLAQTSKLLAVTFVTSPDGTKMYSAHRSEQPEVLSTQNQMAATSTNTVRGPSLAMVPMALTANASAPTSTSLELELSASRESVPPGEGIVLKWTTANATSVMASGDWNDPERLHTTTGAQVLVRPIGEYNFTLTAIGKDGGAISKSITVQVSPFAEPLPEITISVPDWTANPLQPASASFSATHATDCSVSSPLLGKMVVPTNGSVEVAPALLRASAATVTCKGPGGTSTKSLY